MDPVTIIGLAAGFVVLLVILFGIWLWVARNRLVSLGTRVDASWGDIRALLRRRAAIVPQLVDTVRGYAPHEQALFDRVAAAGAAATSAEAPGDAAKAEGELQASLRGLFGVAESYPQLQASHSYLQAHQELVDSENEVQASRRVYNGGVRELGRRVRSFPSGMFARGLGLTGREFFEVDDPAAVAEPPRVQF